MCCYCIHWKDGIAIWRLERELDKGLVLTRGKDRLLPSAYIIRVVNLQTKQADQNHKDGMTIM